MKIEIKGSRGFNWVLVEIEPGESFFSESGAMFTSTTNIEIDVSTKTIGRGGILSGVKRLLSSEHFFFSKYTINGNQIGKIGLAPALPGEIMVVKGNSGWYCTGGSYIGSDENINVDTEFKGFKGLFASANLYFLTLDGEGEFIVSGFGRLAELEVDGELIVDTGHIVAFEKELDFSISKAGTSWLHSFFAGEGFIVKFSGKGKVIVQSHNKTDFGKLLGRLLPPRKG